MEPVSVWTRMPIPLAHVCPHLRRTAPPLDGALARLWRVTRIQLAVSVCSTRGMSRALECARGGKRASKRERARATKRGREGGREEGREGGREGEQTYRQTTQGGYRQ
jgi:hypothetical protein